MILWIERSCIKVATEVENLVRTWVKSLLSFNIADCLPSGVKLKILRKDGIKSSGLMFGVRDKIAMPSAWGLAIVALSGAIANSPAGRFNNFWAVGADSGRSTHKPMSSTLLLFGR